MKLSPEEMERIGGFWDWFRQNKDALAKMGDYSLYVQMAEKLKEIHETLTFELGREDHDQVLAISSDGIKAGIPYVQAVVAAAPEHIVPWKIVAFRQRKPVDSEIDLAGLRLSPQDFSFSYAPESSGKIALSLYIRNFDPADQRYLAIAFILLDNLLGEYTVMMQIGAIDIQPLPSSPEVQQHLLPILQLRSIIDASLN